MKEVSGKIKLWTTIYFTFKVQLSFIQAAVDLRTKSQVICCVGLRCDLLVQRNPFNVKNWTKQKTSFWEPLSPMAIYRKTYFYEKKHFFICCALVNFLHKKKLNTHLRTIPKLKIKKKNFPTWRWKLERHWADLQSCIRRESRRALWHVQTDLCWSWSHWK